MYRILYLTQFHHLGGGETALIYLLAKLDRRLFEPIVLLPQKGQLSDKLKSLKIKTYCLPLNPYLVRTFFIPCVSPIGIYNFLRLAQKIKPNLIHINHLTLAIYAGIAGKILRIPLIATAHGPWDSYYFYQDLATQIFVDKILANTPQTAKLVQRRKIINPSKIAVVPFGIDTNQFRPPPGQRPSGPAARKRLGLSRNDLIITIVGRLDPQKDHLTFLQAAKIIQEEIPNTTFFIVGSSLGDFSGKKSDYNRQIQNFLRKHLNLAKKMVFGGFIDPMPPVYQATDILVSTSHSESFGLSLVEAAACTVPITSTNAGGQKYIIKDGKNGFLVPPKHPDLLAQKILILAKNPKLRAQFGQAGRTHIIKNFPIEKYVQKVQETYLKLLKH